MTKRIPKFVGIQSASCAPLYQAFREGKEEVSSIKKGETLAEGIAIAKPVRGKQILRAVRETGGEIAAAMKAMGRRGHFIEPTSAATIAGLRQYLSKERRREIIVSTLTGIGLKSVGKMV